MDETLDDSSTIPINEEQIAEKQQRPQLENERESANGSAKLFERSRIKELASINMDHFYCSLFQLKADLLDLNK